MAGDRPSICQRSMGPPFLEHEEVHEEVARQRLRSSRKHTVLGVPVVCVQCAHAADESSHLRCGELQHVGAIQQPGCPG